MGSAFQTGRSLSNAIELMIHGQLTYAHSQFKSEVAILSDNCELGFGPNCVIRLVGIISCMHLGRGGSLGGNVGTQAEGKPNKKHTEEHADKNSTDQSKSNQSTNIQHLPQKNTNKYSRKVQLHKQVTKQARK